MKQLRKIVCLLALAMSIGLTTSAQTIAEFRTWAMTPPMGWNSWDCYYSTVTEDIVLKNAQYMKKNLLEYGWEYVVVDIRWYANHPSLGGGNYNQSNNPDCQLDEYGRYLPSPTRFPSVMKDGKNEGFKALADKIHAMGLKFGIHIMRGLPKYILDNPSAYKLKGSEATSWSRVYTSKNPECAWLADNLTVNNNTYGQLYYNSIIDMYAEWGVDFIKVDDISRPFHTNEIAMLRKAINRCGRPIVLSLSPGKTQLDYASSCLKYANMWRMMDDLWDSWSSVAAVFDEARQWSKYTRPGNYADADMLPLGQISMTVGDPGYTGADGGRWTRLTQDEQTTLMTLWGICHSPLFFGGELTKNDKFTNSLLQNKEYFRMHGYSEDNRQVSNQNGQIVWTAIDPDSHERYLALFSTGMGSGWIPMNKALYTSKIIKKADSKHSVDVEVDLPEGTTELALVVDDGGDNYNYDHGDWINPVFVSENGYEVPVTGKFVKRKYTNSYYNVIRENTNVYGDGKMKVDGKTYDKGFASDANTMMLVNVPDSIVKFKAICAADDSGTGQGGATTSIRFLLFTFDPQQASSSEEITVSLDKFGYAADEEVEVYDIWGKAQLEPVKGSVSAVVPAHGAKLLKLSASAASNIEGVQADELNNTENRFYRLNGAAIPSPQKGIFIANGKKYIMK